MRGKKEQERREEAEREKVMELNISKGSCHLRFSGIRPLRGGGVPPFSAKEKNLLFFTLIFR